jgi:hypothetical protein
MDRQECLSYSRARGLLFIVQARSIVSIILNLVAARTA